MKLLQPGRPKSILDAVLLWLLSAVGAVILTLPFIHLSNTFNHINLVLDLWFVVAEYLYYGAIMFWLWRPRRFNLLWLTPVLAGAYFIGPEISFVIFLVILVIVDHRTQHEKRFFYYKSGKPASVEKVIKDQVGQLVSKYSLTQFRLPMWYQALIQKPLAFHAHKSFGCGPKYFALADYKSIRLIKVRLTPDESDDSNNLVMDPHKVWDEDWKTYMLEGHYSFYALSLVAESTDYEPSGLLVWIPKLEMFGTYDEEHRDVYVYPRVEQDSFLALVATYVSGQWHFRDQSFGLGEKDMLHLYRQKPWNYFDYNNDTS